MATHEKRGDSYKITVSLSYDIDGNQIRKRTTWTPEPGMTPKQEQKELDRQKVLFEEKCQTGQVLNGNIRLADFIELWWKDYAEKQLKAKTLANYKDKLQRVLPALGHIRLDKLGPHHLLSFYNNLGEKGIRGDTKYICSINFQAYLKKRKITQIRVSQEAGVCIGVVKSLRHKQNVAKESAERIAAWMERPLEKVFKPADDRALSSSTIQYYHRLLSSILSTAVEWQVIPSNPCERVKAPKVDRTEPNYLDDEQALQLLELLEQEPLQYRVIFTLLLFTGLRRGELCGLEWSDIDFEHSVIHIRRESLYTPDKGIYVEDGKTGSAMRSMKMPPSAMELLQSYKSWQAEQRLKLGDRWEHHDRLFTTWNGKPIFPDTVTNRFRGFIEKTGFVKVTPHQLRHTNASLMIANGTPITTVSKRLGHANAAVTGKIYAHAIRSADAAAAEALEDFLGKKKEA